MFLMRLPSPGLAKATRLSSTVAVRTGPTAPSGPDGSPHFLPARRLQNEFGPTARL